MLGSMALCLATTMMATRRQRERERIPHRMMLVWLSHGFLRAVCRVQYLLVVGIDNCLDGMRYYNSTSISVPKPGIWIRCLGVSYIVISHEMDMISRYILWYIMRYKLLGTHNVYFNRDTWYIAWFEIRHDIEISQTYSRYWYRSTISRKYGMMYREF